jgi:hypothetical protein
MDARSMNETRRAAGSAGPFAWGRALREGTIAGLVGYAAVVVVVALLDVIAGRPPLHTAAALGAWLFHPDPGPEASLWPAAVAYNGLHLVGSIVVGIVGSLAVFLTERHASVWYLALMALIVVAMYAMGAMGAAAVEIGGVSDWPTITLGTGAWLLAMTAYLWWAHRRFVRALGRGVEMSG